MRIIVDGDACPVKELVAKAARRCALPLLFVSNKAMAFGAEPGVTEVLVPAGADEADRWIAQEVKPGDLVITADLPLADKVVEAGALALGHRGERFDAFSIGERMATWTLHRELREQGLDMGGPKAYGPKDRQAFAAALDRELQRMTKAASRPG